MVQSAKRFEELTVEEFYDVLKLRQDAFVVEQNCPYPELDEFDKKCWHLWLKEDGAGKDDPVLAYVRVLDPGTHSEEPAIGRVVSAVRGKGYGKAVMEAGIALARKKYPGCDIRIEAQTYAGGFYEKLGFRQVSDEFVLDGIPHIEMLLEGKREG